MTTRFSPAPSRLKDVQTHFCPGCHHGTIHRLVAEAMDASACSERTIGVASVGCSVFLYGYFDIDVVEAPHGRAPAVATGVKRARPDSFVFTYQGDGDLAAIGTSEIIHAANRGEEHDGHLRQQHHLWHDRRPDGADHPAGAAHHDLPLGAQRRHRRLSDAHGRTPRRT